MPRECTGHGKHPLPIDKRRLYTWTSADGQHRNQIDYILCSQRWRSSIQSAKTRPGADCGSDHELLNAKFRLKLKEVGKTTRPFRCDINHIPYSGISEVAQSCPTLCDPVDCSPPGSSIHGILQAGILEWLPFPSRGDLPNPGIEPRSPALQADAVTSEPPGK